MGFTSPKVKREPITINHKPNPLVKVLASTFAPTGSVFWERQGHRAGGRFCEANRAAFGRHCSPPSTRSPTPLPPCSQAHRLWSVSLLLPRSQSVPVAAPCQNGMARRKEPCAIPFCLQLGNVHLTQPERNQLLIPSPPHSFCHLPKSGKKQNGAEGLLLVDWGQVLR